MSLLRGAYLGPSDYRELLTTAGYSKVDIFTNDRKGWICTLARK